MVDGLLQLRGAVECSAANHSPSDQGKKTFHLIQPGTARRSEMKMEAAPLLGLKPALHLGAFVGAVVVHNQMHFLAGRELLFEMIQEFDELPTAVARLAGADDFAVQYVERGEKCGRAMSFVVMRLSFWQARPQR